MMIKKFSYILKKKKQEQFKTKEINDSKNKKIKKT